jgi:hypothetical protein
MKMKSRGAHKIIPNAALSQNTDKKEMWLIPKMLMLMLMEEEDITQDNPILDIGARVGKLSQGIKQKTKQSAGTNSNPSKKARLSLL